MWLSFVLLDIVLSTTRCRERSDYPASTSGFARVIDRRLARYDYVVPPYAIQKAKRGIMTFRNTETMFPVSVRLTDEEYIQTEVKRCADCLSLSSTRTCAFHPMNPERACTNNKKLLKGSRITWVASTRDPASECYSKLKFNPSIPLIGDRCRYSGDSRKIVDNCGECVAQSGCLWSETYGCMINRGFAPCEYETYSGERHDGAEGFFSTNNDPNYGIEYQDTTRCEWVSGPNPSVCQLGPLGGLRYSHGGAGSWKPFAVVAKEFELPTTAATEYANRIKNEFETATTESSDGLESCIRTGDTASLMCRIVHSSVISTSDSASLSIHQRMERNRLRKALFILGPSAAGKTFSSRRMLSIFQSEADRLCPSGITTPGWRGALFRTLDGGLIRDESHVYQEMRQLVHGRSVEIAGISDLMKEFFQNPISILKKRLFSDWTAHHQNMVIVETGVDFWTVIGRTTGAEFLGKVGDMFKHLFKNHYEIGMMVVYASLASCERAGHLRESQEGKKYDSDGWAYALTLIPDAIKRLQQASTSCLRPIVLVDNSDFLNRVTYWLFPEQEELNVVLSHGTVLWRYRPRGSTGSWQNLPPSDDLKGRFPTTEPTRPRTHRG
eukprot:c9782_g1_i2.p1 GENE.c9782_g1_i2~~c9782_g1_i2.p1  ORF type:complete len:611 (+),score=133.01 c9782_g1_i2:31-1863(+)